jgi:hypothetical protein
MRSAGQPARLDSFASLVGGVGRQPVAKGPMLPQQAQPEMLGLDVTGTQHAGLITGEKDGAASLFGIAFKHAEALFQYAPEDEDWYSR